MTMSHSPAPARSDVVTATPTTGSPEHPYRTHGRILSVGAASWAISTAVFGLNNESTLALAVTGLGAGLFQIGLLLLLRVLWQTRALGEGRIARTVLRIESVVVGLAIASTVVDAIQVSDLTQPGWAMLDACWPLSMLGMLFIGIRIAIAGRWTGPSRFWPMVAESWAVVVIPTLGIFGSTVATWVSLTHLLLGYTVLGVLVSHKQG